MEQTQARELDSYVTLRSVDLGEHVEKKQNLSYISWAWAVDQLLLRDPTATWEYRFGKDGGGNEVPFIYIGDTAMVFCTVRAFGVERTAQLPVMDHRNRPIPNPDSFQVNTAMQRALAKAISLHGLGLYIYAGEDLPPKEETPEPEPKVTADELQQAKDLLKAAKTKDDLRKVYGSLNEHLKAATEAYSIALAKGLQ